MCPPSPCRTAHVQMLQRENAQKQAVDVVNQKYQKSFNLFTSSYHVYTITITSWHNCKYGYIFFYTYNCKIQWYITTFFYHLLFNVLKEKYLCYKWEYWQVSIKVSTPQMQKSINKTLKEKVDYKESQDYFIPNCSLKLTATYVRNFVLICSSSAKKINGYCK